VPPPACGSRIAGRRRHLHPAVARARLPRIGTVPAVGT